MDVYVELLCVCVCVCVFKHKYVSEIYVFTDYLHIASVHKTLNTKSTTTL